MSERLNDFDPTHAIFGAMGSFWWRILVFFACCFVGHFVGVNCAGAAEFFDNLWTNGPRTAFDHDGMNPLWVPLTWLGTLLVGCRDGWGLIQLVVLAVAFLFVWLSEDRFIHGFAIAALSQPVDSFLVEGTSNTTALVVGLVVLAVWEAFVAGVYWWCWKQIE